MVVDDARLLNRRRVATFDLRSAILLVIVEAIVLPVDLESIRTGSLYCTKKLQTIQIISGPNIYLDGPHVRAHVIHVRPQVHILLTGVTGYRILGATWHFFGGYGGVAGLVHTFRGLLHISPPRPCKAIVVAPGLL